MDKNYKQFVDKLNLYIKKFYLYQLVRGILLFALIFIVYSVFIFLLEYFNYFEPRIKLVIVGLTLFFTLVILVYYVIIPLLKLAGIGKRINYLDVSDQLKNTFPEIKDKLVNIIELESNIEEVYSNSLRRASIDQKINELSIFSFTDSIRFKDLKLVFLAFTTILIIFFSTLLISPDYITESSVRLIHFQEKFEKPAPFQFRLLNDDLEIITGESIDIKVSCIGKELPEMVYLNFGGNSYLMKNENGFYSYTIENINSSFSFYFTDKKYLSEMYKLTVLNKPFVTSFKVSVNPPSYTNLETEELNNIGDLKIVSGSSVSWQFTTVDTDSLFIYFNDSTKFKAEKNNTGFKFTKAILKDTEYWISVKNDKIIENKKLVYKIQTVADLYPEIGVVKVSDTIDFKTFYFKGNLIDDFGFHKLEFVVEADGKDSIFEVPFVPFMLNQDFYYSFNFESVKSLGKSFKYYFSVYDNDFINHFKKTISETFAFTFPDYQEIALKENESQNSIEALFEKSSKLTEEIQREFQDFKLKQINSEMSDWDKFQSVKNIMQKRTELENVLNQIKNQNEETNKFLNSFTEEKSDIVDKQKQIEKLLEEVFTDELKKLFEEFNNLAKQFDSREFERLSKELDYNLDDLSKQLDKNVQLLRKMKVEQKVERIVDQLNNVITSEEENVKKLDSKSDISSVKSDEKSNSELIDQLFKDYNDALDLNKSLEKPINLFDFTNEFSKLKENYNSILDDLERNNKRKSTSGIEKNIKDEKELAFAMDQMLKNARKKQTGVDINDLKQILDNVVIVSFDQEKLLNKFKAIDFNNPLVNDLKIKQKAIVGQVQFLRDSLYALSKRTPSISSVINKELLNLETSVNAAIDNLENGNIGSVTMQQQFGITAANNLALFLSEALESLKEQEKNAMPGDGEKSGKKGSKPSFNNLKDSQQSIKDQLQQMIDQMKKGETGKLSKSIGQTIAQQEIMQQLIREMINSGTVGTKTGNSLKVIDQMLEQNRIDLINKRINSEMVNRQNIILSKLLEAEKAEIERDFDDKRESKSVKDYKVSNPQGYFEYNNVLNENEFIKRSNYKLRGFYEQKYNSFLNQIKH